RRTLQGDVGRRGPLSLQVWIAPGRLRRGVTLRGFRSWLRWLRALRSQRHRDQNKRKKSAHGTSDCCLPAFGSSGLEPPTNSFFPSANVTLLPLARMVPFLA